MTTDAESSASGSDGGLKPGWGPELTETVYAELRRRAQVIMNQQYQSHTLRATDLVHEAYMKLVASERGLPQDRSHLFALAAKAMRQTVVDRARAKGRLKRGGGARSVELDSNAMATPVDSADVLAVDEALERLATLDARQARVVELKFFGGLEMEKIAEVLGASKRAVEEDWTMARSTLRQWLIAG